MCQQGLLWSLVACALMFHTSVLRLLKPLTLQEVLLQLVAMLLAVCLPGRACFPAASLCSICWQRDVMQMPVQKATGF